jgi:cytochrome d ubiquinol oxidase subunit II
VICYVVTTMVTLLYVPHMVVPFKKHPLFLAVPILTLLAIANIPRELYHGKELRAFLSSSASMVGLLTLFGLGMFPYLVYSNPHPQFSLTVYNAASSPKTLKIMLIIALMGMPLVLAYTIAIYRVFRGKVKLTSSSY